MAANTSPIFSLQGQVATDGVVGMSSAILAAAADYTGISANNRLVFTADANGSYISRLRFKAVGSNVLAVMRIYLNNGSTPTTAANNSFFGEVSLPGTTASVNSATAEVDYPMGFALPPGFRIYAGLGAAVAAGWVVTAIAGDY